MTRRCAVIGVGQTRHAAARQDVTLGGLVREAAERALADAGLGWREVDAVVLGKAPDMLEGVMSPELSLADALGAVGKPIHRAYTSGSAGGVAASMGVSLVTSGLHARVLVVCFEKQSEARAAGATLQPLPFEAPWHGGTGSLFAAVCREYIARSGAPPETGDRAALKDRRNAARNEYAQIRKPGLTLADIASSKMLWDPIRLLHSSPSSDGACAIVVADEATAGGSARRGCSAARCAASRRCRPGTTTSIRGLAATARRPSTGRPASPTRRARSTSRSCSFPTAGWSRSCWRTWPWRNRVRDGG